MLHGVPTWSYLYRKIIPNLADSGYRVIVPDLAGFGMSDKPKDSTWHTLSNHVSVIGLRAASGRPERFKGIIISNGGLPPGIEKARFSFLLWRVFALISPIFPIGRIVNYGCLRRLTPGEIKAYCAPFPHSLRRFRSYNQGMGKEVSGFNTRIFQTKSFYV